MLYSFNQKNTFSFLSLAGQRPLSKGTLLNVSTKMHLTLKRSMQRSPSISTKLMSLKHLNYSNGNMSTMASVK